MFEIKGCVATDKSQRVLPVQKPWVVFAKTTCYKKMKITNKAHEAIQDSLKIND